METKLTPAIPKDFVEGDSIFTYGGDIWMVINDLNTNFGDTRFVDQHHHFHAFNLTTHEVTYFDKDGEFEMVELVNSPILFQSKIIKS
jgi:hypothetical protein